MTMLILGRGLQGIGGGGILPLCQSVIADVVAPRERGRYQAYMGVVWVTSGVGGPVLGGVLAEHLALVADLLDQRAARARAPRSSPTTISRASRATTASTSSTCSAPC